MRTRRKKLCRRESADTKNSELVELLPSDVWIKILEMGIDNSILTHKDLCSLSISSKYFNKISVEDTLWSTLLALDFPNDDDDESSTSTPFQPSCMKSLYIHKVKLQLDSLRRTIDDIRGESVVITRQLRQLRTRLTKQKERLKEAQEFSDAQEIWYGISSVNLIVLYLY
ncbi:hypothetical protein ACHQM5_006644 [Ranunculus cassubicifolius]